MHALLREAASELAVHFIYHVPKCAGQTVDRHLAGALAPDVYCRTTRRRGVGRFLASRHAFEQPPDPHRTKVISGHHLGPSVEPLVAGREVKRSILLRDPVSHAVSYYNFRMMRYLSEGLHPYSFALAYGAMQRNFIAHYILRNFLEVPWHRLARFSDNDKYDIVNAFLATFWFVGDYRLCDEVSLVPTVGHTPGHVSVRISSRGEEALITGDFMHHPCQIARPDWSSAADSDPEAARLTRERMLGELCDRPVLVIGTHFAGATAGRIVRDGDSYRLAV